MKNSEQKKGSYGLWEVTTEGDCEGRSTNSLGIFEGTLEDVILHCMDQCCYTLTISKFEILKPNDTIPKHKTYCDIRTKHITSNELKKYEKEFSKINIISEVNFYGNISNFTVSLENTEETKKAMKKAEMLKDLKSRYSEEELKLLGL